MSIAEGAIKYSDLIGRLILDLRTTDELGRVDDIWMVPDSHRVVGIFYKSGFLANQKKSLTLSQIETIGTDAVMVSSLATMAIEETKQSDSLIGHEVWTEEGSKIGKISDFLFDAKTGVISHYLFAASGWSGITDGTYLLETAAIGTLGKKRLIIPEAIATGSTLYTEGLRQRFGTVVEQTKERTQALGEQAKGLLGQVKERAQSLGDQVKERAQTLSDEAKERTQAFGDQVKERAHTFGDEVKERAQTLGDEVKERTQSLGDQVKDRTQALSDTARDGVSDLLENAQEKLHPPASQPALPAPATVVAEEPIEIPPARPTLPTLPPTEPAPDYTRDLL